MRQKFTIRGEFLLPENFSGGFKEALELYYQHSIEKWDNKLKYPATLPDQFCFPWTVENGGESYTTFAIESYRFENLGEEFELEAAEQEELEMELCSESNQ